MHFAERLVGVCGRSEIEGALGRSSLFYGEHWEQLKDVGCSVLITRTMQIAVRFWGGREACRTEVWAVVAARGTCNLAWNDCWPSFEAGSSLSERRHGCAVEMGEGKAKGCRDDAQHDKNRAEYGALADLAGVEHNHGLGGLPLGLVKAGSFVRNIG